MDMKAIIKSDDGVTLSLFLAPEGANDRTLIGMLMRQYPALRYDDSLFVNNDSHVMVPIFQGYQDDVPYRNTLMAIRSGAVIQRGSTAIVRESQALDAVTIRDAVIVVMDSPGEGSRENWEIERVAVNGVERPLRDGCHQLGDVVAGANVAIWVRHKTACLAAETHLVEFSARVMASRLVG
jgi:hypothetical protein